MLRILLIGKGGREHALAEALLRSPACSELVAAPGSDAIAELCACHPVDMSSLPDMVGLANEWKPDLVVIGPEAPLAMGLSDALTAAGFLVFAPSRAAARIESSKIWAKEMMRKAGVATADYEVFSQKESLREALKKASYPVVLKADGLCAGKGVAVCSDPESALAFSETLIIDPEHPLLLEEYLKGFEFSLIVAANGERFFAFPPAQDYKRIFDGDQGPNTGGMGAVSPVLRLSRQLEEEAIQRVITPVLKTLCKEGCPFRGFLYAGLMVTEKGLRVIEFNARFGDPEAEVILPCLEGDFAAALSALCEGREIPPLRFKKGCCLGLVLASRAYPAASGPATVIPHALLKEIQEDKHFFCFHMGTEKGEGKDFISNGGRVLFVGTLAADLSEARHRLYGLMDRHQENLRDFQYRRDIGRNATER